MTEHLTYLTRICLGLEPWPVAKMHDLDEFVDYLHDILIPDLRESGRDETAADFETAIFFIASLSNDEVRRGGYPGPDDGVVSDHFPPEDEPDMSRFVSQPGDMQMVKPAPCGCECCTPGGFCGGCGHVGCGRRS
jgi:hypothetical protein